MESFHGANEDQRLPDGWHASRSYLENHSSKELMVTDELIQKKRELSQEIWQLHHTLDTGLSQRYTGVRAEKSLEDIAHNLVYLSEALQAFDSSLFLHYVSWLNTMLTARDVPTVDLMQSFICTKAVLRKYLSPELNALAETYLNAAIDLLRNNDASLRQGLDSGEHLLLPERDHYLNLLLQNKRHEAYQFIRQLRRERLSLQDIYLHIFQGSQYQIGRLWQENKITVAQEHYCTAVTQNIMSLLLPDIFLTRKNGLRMLACCTEGELHELGLRMVTDFFELDGWDTYFIGANTPIESTLELIRSQQIDLVAISTTMTYHVSKVRQVIARIRDNFQHAQLKIVVGGFPFRVSPGLWKQVGADGFAHDAREALYVAGILFKHRLTSSTTLSSHGKH